MDRETVLLAPSAHPWKRLLLLVIATAGCLSSNYAHLYQSAANAPSLASADIAALKYMGPVFSDQGVNFAVYSENATKIQLLLFDNDHQGTPSQAFNMSRIGNVWSVYIQGVGSGQIYGYRAWGPNWNFDPTWNPGSITGFNADVDGSGNRFNPNKLLFDPYSKAITKNFDWGQGSSATGPQRVNVDYAAAMKSVVVFTGNQGTYAWSPNESTYRTGRQNEATPGHQWNDLIIYEVQAKGATMDPASGVAHPGTFRGLGEMAGYFQSLGITAIQVMPIFQKPQDGWYWGYQTMNYFSPEYTFSSAPDYEGRINEFKWMVDQFHQANIEVILDVVYNHTGEGGLWAQKIQYGGGTLDQTLDSRNWGSYAPVDTAGIYAYRGLDNASYYALSSTDPGYYNDGSTGVGNAMRSNYKPFRQLILDSLRYWVSEMHVDGFRFDLAVELGQPDLLYDCGLGANTTHGPNFVMQTVLQDIVDDPVLQSWNTRVIAEPWGMNCYGLGGFPASTTQPGNGWYEHNGQFRDWWRSFVNHHPPTPQDNGNATDPDWWENWQLADSNGNMYGSNADGAYLLFGSQSLFYDPVNNTIAKRRHPYNSVNFITVHDGFTLYDLVSYRLKENGCGPLGPECCQPVTAYCNNDGSDDNRSFNWGILSDAEIQSCGARSDCDTYCASQNDPNGYQDCRNYWCGTNSACIGGIKSQHEFLKRQLVRDLFTSMMISRGTPMILGGDEWLRTQLGNNNAYIADNSFNWFEWGDWLPSDEAERMHDFVTKLIQFRKDHAYIFAPTDYTTASPVNWMSATGNAPAWSCPAGSPDDCGRTLMVDYPPQNGHPEVVVLINMSYSNVVSFSLPAGTGNWERLIDTDQSLELANPGAPPHTADAYVNGNVTESNPVPISGGMYLVNPKSIVVLQAD
jgi:glycogen operon protein